MQVRAAQIYDGFVWLASRHPVGVLLGSAVVVGLSLILTITQLSFHTSRLDLISTGDRLIQLDQAFIQEFDVSFDDVMVVIRSDDPEQAKRFAIGLGEHWEQAPHIEDVLYRIDVEALRHKTLFHLSHDELIALRHTLQQHQAFLGELAAAPTLQTLFSLINEEITAALVGHAFTVLPAEKREQRPPDLSLLLGLLQEMNRALEGHGLTQSPWAAWLGPADEALPQDGFLWSDTRELLFVFANPVETPGEFSPFSQTIQRIRADVRALQPAYPGVDVGITGRAVLDADEMSRAQRDMMIASLIALGGAALLFVVFFRGVTKPAFVVVTLVTGLCWSLGWTTLTIGHLNIFTIVFAPVLIGLGIDYGIHFTARYEEERASGRPAREALHQTFTGTGGGIVTAAFTTACVFFALLFTRFKGFGELGFITGSGLLLMLLSTFTCLPALLVLADRQRHGSVTTQQSRDARPPGGYLEPLYRYPRGMLAISALIVLLSLLGLGHVRFDLNLLRLQDQGAESVIWVQKIFERSQQSLLFGEVVAASLEEVRHKAEALQALPSVARVESIASVLPADQESKIPLIQGLRPLLVDLPLLQGEGEPVDLQALRATLGSIQFKMVEISKAPEEMQGAIPRQEVHGVRQLIAQFFATTERLGDAHAVQALTAFQQALMQDLRATLDTLQANLEAEPLTPADLPPELRQRYIGRTGFYRLFAFPSENIWEFEPLTRFVTDLRSVDPYALGTPVLNFSYLLTVQEGYQRAGIYAFVAVVFLAFLAFRAVPPTLLALIPLTVGASWTVGLMVLLRVPLNVANVIFLPLIMGLGIDSGIYLVHRFRRAVRRGEVPLPLAQSTGKAIALSSLTTMLGFGSLMISSHRGIFSLGLLVVLGVGSILLASLVVLPSILALLASRRENEGPPPPPDGARAVGTNRSERSPLQGRR